MSYPPRSGMPPMGMPPFMGMSGVPPPGMPMGLPPNLLSGPPPGNNGPPPMQFFHGTPPPRSMSGHPSNQGLNRSNSSHIITGKSTVQLPADHPAPISLKNVPMGPPVTVFVGNITEKWPDAMIRQLLATCGHVLNWKRVQGASGKLQGFGFCEFNGPDAGLRAVRLLHDIEVGDKKLVVKVDAKTSTVLEEFKAERKKRKEEDVEEGEELKEESKGEEEEEEEDYMDQEMKELDERSRMRISILFREFKNELESYIPPGDKPGKEKDPASKQAIQDKLHLLKLTSLDAPPSDADASDDIAVEEGKREIITQEISKFREHMKQEKEKEEERKRLGRERRERQKEREDREKAKKDRDGGSKSPSSRRRDRSRSPVKRPSPTPSASRSKRSRSPSKTNDNYRNRDRDSGGRRGRDDRMGMGRENNNRERERDRDRDRERDRERERMDRDRGNRDRRRSRDRSPVPRFRSSRDRERSPMMAPHKRRYREREEEEEAEEQRKQDKKAREKEAAYDEKLRQWEQREAKRAREIKKEKERQERVAEDIIREARKMKQFLEDYDDEKMDIKYYKGKDLQKRLSDRAKELEMDNRDRQREREEIEEMRLKVLTGNVTSSVLSGTIPVITLDRPHKKPMMDSTNTSLSSSPSQFQSLSSRLNKSPAPLSASSSVAARLQAIAGQIPSQHQSVTQNNGGSLSLFNRRTLHDSSAPVARQAAQETAAPVTVTRRPKTPPPPPKIELDFEEPSKYIKQPQTSFDSIQFSSFVPIKGKTSNPSTPNSLVSPAGAIELSPSLKSLANTGFQLNMNNNSNASSSSVKADEDETRHSFSSANSPGGMASPMNYGGGDDSSLQDSPDFNKKKKMDVKDIFNQEEEDDGLGSARKRKLVPLDYGEAKLKKEEKVLEDKKKHVKSLIDRIPTEKDALFAHEIDWSMVDTTLMEKRIRPWINKKIIEYIGEPEPTLVDFICTKVLAKSEPKGILEDVQMVLDEEAEVFVVKMWRLLIYEIEAKKIGLASKPT